MKKVLNREGVGDPVNSCIIVGVLIVCSQTIYRTREIKLLKDKEPLKAAQVCLKAH